jgi:hypothetical protein
MMIPLSQRTWKPAALVGIIAGFIIAVPIMYVAWEHNAQCEIHEGEVVHWVYWGGIGLSWWLIVAVPGTVLTAVLIAVARRITPPKPQQPTRAAEPNGQREPEGSGPRG